MAIVLTVSVGQLDRIVHRISGESSATAAARTTVREISHLLGSSRTVLAFFDADGQTESVTRHIVGLAGDNGPMLQEDERFLKTAYEKSQIVMHEPDDVLAFPAIAAPCQLGTRQIGAIGVVFGSADHAITSAEADALSLIGVFAALTIENLRRPGAIQESVSSHEDLSLQSQRLRALGEMAAGVVNDINNMLTAALGPIELILASSTDPATSALLLGVQKALLDAAQTVRRIQDFARQTQVRPPGEIDVDRLAEASATIPGSVPAVPGPTITDTGTVVETESRPLTVMVIDDQPTVAAVLRLILEVDGNRAVAFENGPDAVGALHTLPWDLVCTDIEMPDMNGWEVALKVNEALPGVPVVVVTGWSETYDPADLKRRGVHSVLSKPYQIRDIRALLALIRTRRPN